MKNLAPEIVRERLLIEGFFTIPVSNAVVDNYLMGITRHLDLHAYGPPIVHSPHGLSKDGNDGFDAFIPLIDSGISLYIWTKPMFFAAVIFSCKTFDRNTAVDFTQEYFGARITEHQSF